MSIDDKIKWNNKYKNKPNLLKPREASEKLKSLIKYAKGKDVLEIACGSGRNSIYLAKNGFNITALDISDIAIETLNKQNIENIKTEVVDLENYTPKENSYDLIVKTNYLDKVLIPKLAQALKKDGILFIETYMQHEENEKKDSNPEYLLKKEELKSFFNDEFEIIDYDEFLNENYEMYKMMKQSICIKKLI
jgi:2-polyprenyl-3-methyl-5-hydroxy-6-metoxy-1,4-benzoquinol methylase